MWQSYPVWEWDNLVELDDGDIVDAQRRVGVLSTFLLLSYTIRMHEDLDGMKLKSNILLLGDLMQVSL